MLNMIARSPDRNTVLKGLRRVLSSLHSSGDPDQPGGYSLTLKILPQSSDTEKFLSVNGKIDGQVVSGEVKIHLSDGEFDGWEYRPEGGTTDVSQDPEDMLQVVLDAATDELQLN